MQAKYPHQLIVRNAGNHSAIHDRNVLGTRPVGKPLGWMRGKRGAWFVQLPGGIDLPVQPTRHEALGTMISAYRAGRLPE